MSKQELLQTTASEALKASPPASVAIYAQAHGWTMASTVTLLTVVYLVLQILWLLWRWWKDVKSSGGKA